MSAWTENRLGLLTVAGVALLNLVVVGMVAVNGPVPPSSGYDAGQSGPVAPVQQPALSDRSTQSPNSIPDEGVYPAPDPQPAEADKSAAERPVDSNAPADPPATPSVPPAPDSPSAPTDGAGGSASAPADSGAGQDAPIVIPIPPSQHDSGDNPQSGGAPPSGDNAGAASDAGSKPSSDAAAGPGTSSSDSAGAPADSGKP